MSGDETAALQKLGQDIRYWKKFAFPGFATGVLNLDAAIKSIDSPDPCIYARQDYPARWLICKVGSRHKAMFHTAAVWDGSSHLDTGNYVPEGQSAPTNMPESRIQRIPSNRCQVDYIINTQYDKTLFGHQAAFETLVNKAKEFNKGGKPRRSWQKGDDGYDRTFTFSAQIFMRSYGNDGMRLKDPPYVLHPWIRDVVHPMSGKQDYFANPYRPEMWDCRTGTMIRMVNADPPSLQKGDIVWISFSVEFIIGAHTWSTQLTPRHFIRVGTMPRILLGLADGNDGSPDDEPDYTIEEGIKVLLNGDYPMDDELTNGVEKTGDANAPRNQASPLGGSTSANELQLEKLENPVCPDVAMSTQDTKKVVAGPIGPSDCPRSGEDVQPVVVPHAHTDPIIEAAGTLTPVPTTPGPTTPTPSEWSPSVELQVSGDGDNMGTASGVKREGQNDDMESCPPAKKSRQTGARRPRNMQ